MKSIFQRLLFLFLGLSALVLAGCSAAPATPEAMSVQGMSLQSKQPHSVTVMTYGGAETKSGDSTNISDASLQAAIENSIVQSNLFNRIVQGGGGEYILTVSITQVRKPTVATGYTADLETAWSLVKASDKSIALKKVVISSYSVPASDTSSGKTKLRLSVEGAARNNIAQGLKVISNLDLDPQKYRDLGEGKVLGFNDKQQASYQIFLSKPLPRAFAVSKNGGDGYAWGNSSDDKSAFTDPKQRALDVCQKYARQACRLYMVDEQVVYPE